MLKSEWTNRDALDCSNITCANCQYNDGVIYTSLPPQYKCTITNKFHHNNDKCDVEFALVKHGHWVFSPKDAIEMMFTLPKCSECGAESSDSGNYCFNCGAKMDEVCE